MKNYDDAHRISLSIKYKKTVALLGECAFAVILLKNKGFLLKKYQGDLGEKGGYWDWIEGRGGK